MSVFSASLGRYAGIAWAKVHFNDPGSENEAIEIKFKDPGGEEVTLSMHVAIARLARNSIDRGLRKIDTEREAREEVEGRNGR